MVAGLIFTVYFGLVQVHHFKLATEVVRGKYTKVEEDGVVFQGLLPHRSCR